MEEKFEYMKGVIKNRIIVYRQTIQWPQQKDKRTTNYPQLDTQKTKD